jgi:hypothetical protein
MHATNCFPLNIFFFLSQKVVKVVKKFNPTFVPPEPGLSLVDQRPTVAVQISTTTMIWNKNSRKRSNCSKKPKIKISHNNGELSALLDQIRLCRIWSNNNPTSHYNSGSFLVLHLSGDKDCKPTAVGHLYIWNMLSLCGLCCFG